MVAAKTKHTKNTKINAIKINENKHGVINNVLHILRYLPKKIITLTDHSE